VTSYTSKREKKKKETEQSQPILQVTFPYFQIISNSVVIKREMYRKTHYSHDCAAFQAAPAQAAHAVSLPGPSCSESEPSADSPSQSLLPEHAPPAPPVHCTHSTLSKHMQQCSSSSLRQNGTLLKDSVLCIN